MKSTQKFDAKFEKIHSEEKLKVKKWEILLQNFP